jgi:hypothetical protein
MAVITTNTLSVYVCVADYRLMSGVAVMPARALMLMLIPSE